MKTPQDFNIDPYGARNGKGIYSTKWICYYDAEDYIEQCRTRFAEDVYGVAPLPPYDKATQQFLVACLDVFKKKGDDGLRKFFTDFTEYVLANLSAYKGIEEKRDYNARVIAYNDYVCEQSSGKLTHNVVHPDYILKWLEWLPQNWRSYWDWCGGDTQNYGGNFRRYYAEQEGREKWGERYDYFVNNLANIFIERVNEEIKKRKALV